MGGRTGSFTRVRTGWNRAAAAGVEIVTARSESSTPDEGATTRDGAVEPVTFALRDARDETPSTQVDVVVCAWVDGYGPGPACLLCVARTWLATTLVRRWGVVLVPVRTLTGSSSQPHRTLLLGALTVTEWLRRPARPNDDPCEQPTGVEPPVPFGQGQTTHRDGDDLASDGERDYLSRGGTDRMHPLASTVAAWIIQRDHADAATVLATATPTSRMGIAAGDPRATKRLDDNARRQQPCALRRSRSASTRKARGLRSGCTRRQRT